MFLIDKIKQLVTNNNGLRELPENPNDTADRLFLVNNIDEINKHNIEEYDLWYYGDGNELLNYYKRMVNIDYNFEPFYDQNKRSYFWAVSATEDDVKRTHSGMPRQIVDTLTGLVKYPRISLDNPLLTPVWKQIEKENSLPHNFVTEMQPMTYVEGYGAYKWDWNEKISSHPILQYYRALNVEFTYSYKTRLTSIIYKDYYAYKDRQYILIETRYHDANKSLVLHKDFYELGKDDTLFPVDNKKVYKMFPQLAGQLDHDIIITNYRGFLGTPTIIFEDTEHIGYGRSIYKGKVDLFDDLDQVYSQLAQAVRRSSIKVYYDTEILAKDENGLPIMPKAFDTKYVMYDMRRNPDGTNSNQDPIKTSQPVIDFSSYDAVIDNLKITTLEGVMSPATFGIDVARKDNADAQREKEKVTIFTRNLIIDQLKPILTTVVQEGMWLNKYINDTSAESSGIDSDYTKLGVTIDFEEFADSSYENKATVLSNLYNLGTMTPNMFVDKLYGNSLSLEDKKRELDYLIKEHEDAKSGGLDNLIAAGGAGGEDDEEDNTPSPQQATAPDDGNITNAESKEKSESDITNASFHRNNEK